MYVKIISLLLLGLAALFALLAVKYSKESSDEEDEDAKVIRDIRSRLKRGKKVVMTLEEIGRLSWLKNTEEPCNIKVGEEYKDLYSYPGVKKKSKKETEQAPACVQEFYKLKNEVTSAFFEEVVQPFLELLQERGTLDVVMRILMFLSTEGNIPSVAGSTNRTVDSHYSYAVLRKVSLVQHSVDTARIGMEILKEKFPFYYDIIPDKYLVLFLGHDLGKVAPSKGYTSYTTQDHPIFSARLLRKFIPESFSWRNDVIEAVRNHHSSVDLRNPYSTPEKTDLWILQTADRKARESELRLSSDLVSPETVQDSEPTKLNQQPDQQSDRQPDRQPDWRAEMQPYQASGAAIRGMFPAEVLEEILPLVNHIVSSSDPVFDSSAIPPGSPEGNFLAVSQPDGVVYIRPDVIYYAFLRVVNKKAVQRGNAAVLAKPKNEALKDIVHWLTVNNCIPPGHIQPGFYGRWYSFNIGTENQKTSQSLFTPITIRAFGVMPGKLEVKRREIAKIANMTIKKFNRQRGV